MTHSVSKRIHKIMIFHFKAMEESDLYSKFEVFKFLLRPACVCVWDTTYFQNLQELLHSFNTAQLWITITQKSSHPKISNKSPSELLK